MSQNTYNPIESSLIYIRERIPQLIVSVNNAMRATLPERLARVFDVFRSNTNVLINLMQDIKQTNSEFNIDFEDPNLSFLNMLDPINLIRIVGDEPNGPAIMNMFLACYKAQEKQYGNTAENNYTTYEDDLFLEKIRLPFLQNIDLSEMSSVGYQLQSFSTHIIPKLAVKTVKNHKIFEFMNADFESINKNRISETLVGQVDYKTLTMGLLKVYQKVVLSLQNQEELTVPLSFIEGAGLNKIVESPFYSFIYLSRLLETESKIAEQEYLNNTDLSEADKVKYAEMAVARFDYVIESVKSAFEKELDMFIKRVTISMALTYLIKVGRSDIQVGAYDLHRDMLNGLLDITIEDIDYFNNKFSNQALDEESETYKFLNPLYRKKTGTIFRKRLLDYMMLSFLSNKQSNVNFSGYNFFTPINDGTSDTSMYIKTSTIQDNSNSPDVNGSIIYRFVIRNLNEIYSNMTYTSNSDKIILKVTDKKIQTADVKPMIERVINDHVTNQDLKIFINTTMAEVNNFYGTTNLYLYSSNDYTFNTIKNHRALAGLYKAAVHVLFKLLYSLDGIKKYSTYTKTTKVPPEHAERLMYIKSQLRDIYNILNHEFKNPCASRTFNIKLRRSEDCAFPTIRMLNHISPSSIYSLAMLLNGKMTSVAKLTDTHDTKIAENEISEFKKCLMFLDQFRSSEITNPLCSPQFEHCAPIEISSDYTEIYKEFDLDEDIIKSLENFGDLDDPDLRGTHRSLFTSYEELQNAFLTKDQMDQIYDIQDIKKVVDKSIEAMKKTKSIEDLAFLSTGISLYENNFYLYKDPIDAEKNNYIQTHIERFDKALESKCKQFVKEYKQ